MPGTRSPGVRNCQSKNSERESSDDDVNEKNEHYKHSWDKLTVASPQNGWLSHLQTSIRIQRNGGSTCTWEVQNRRGLNSKNDNNDYYYRLVNIIN